MKNFLTHHHRRHTCVLEDHEDRILPKVPLGHRTVPLVSHELQLQDSDDAFLLHRIVTVIPVRSSLVRGGELVYKGVVLRDGTLGDEGCPVSIVRPILEDPMPVLLYRDQFIIM